jgi:hypothetical protein
VAARQKAPVKADLKLAQSSISYVLVQNKVLITVVKAMFQEKYG